MLETWLAWQGDGGRERGDGDKHMHRWFTSLQLQEFVRPHSIWNGMRADGGRKGCVHDGMVWVWYGLKGRHGVGKEGTV
ncbi:hypothetical protein B296_00000586 [Ensete ventricosum]|uniref:Uncharacterized protein n=1 Tax=Ensete ventricosum TaxID=4639 RepID=A0A426ZRX9_ENSVE|nr:hypothetical protein B296_00000586 [Ensete ventricosum]